MMLGKVTELNKSSHQRKPDPNKKNGWPAKQGNNILLLGGRVRKGRRPATIRETIKLFLQKSAQSGKKRRERD